MREAELKPGWDCLSYLLWVFNTKNFFPIKVSYYRGLGKELGIDLERGSPKSSNFIQIMSFGKAFWEFLENAAPKDWVDVQSFIWVCACAQPKKSARVDEPDETEEILIPSLFTVDDALKDLFIEKTEFEGIIKRLKRKKNIILQGAPGVGKTFMAKRIAYALMEEKDPSRISMVQFHQSYSYEDFIEGYRPNENGGFQLKKGAFLNFRNLALANLDKPYIFIIDEINRGNLSRIFGELMMLIESDKRDKEYAMPLTYSPDINFYLPENIYLIGMMNTADRSLALVDYALRRRFAFFSLPPRFESPKFEQVLKNQGGSPELISKIITRMSDINTKISEDTRNLGPGFQIGHSFFCPSADTKVDEAWYRDVVDSEIAPLLREYWMDNVKQAEELVDELLD